MKYIVTTLSLLGLGVNLIAQPAPPAAPPGTPAPTEEQGFNVGHSLQNVPLDVFLVEYQELVGRTLLPAQNLPNVTFSVTVTRNMTLKESIVLYETLLAQRGIAVVPMLDGKAAQIIPAADVTKTPPKFTNVPKDELPDGETYIIYPVTLQYVLPSELVDTLTAYAKSPNAVQGIDSTRTLILRDFASNVKRMLTVLEKLDVEEEIDEEHEIVSIKYALSQDIATVLGSLTTGGSVTGTSSSSTSGSSTRRPTTSGASGARPTSGTSSMRRWATPTRSSSSGRPSSSSSSGRPSSSSGSLQQRLNSITRGSSSNNQPGLLLGDIKVVSYERNNEVLLIGRRRYLDVAKTLINQLDRVQKQVLIEAMIIDVALGDDKSFGASIRQAQQEIGGNAVGGGLSTAIASALGPGQLGANTISGATASDGFQYFMKMGLNWEVAVKAVQNSTQVQMLSRPAIQTSHAELAELFIGEKRPVVTGTITDISGGSSNQYQLQDFGITLNILPFINDENLVVMDITQQVQDIVGQEQINGNNVPITTDRSANSKVAVRDGEMIVLGGFIKNKKTSFQDRVPVLSSIPLLGNMFKSDSVKNERYELIVMLRPTVMDTPAAAAAEALSRQSGLPGIESTKKIEKELEVKYRFLLEEQEKARQKDQRKFQPKQPAAPQNNPAAGGVPALPPIPNN